MAVDADLGNGKLRFHIRWYRHEGVVAVECSFDAPATWPSVGVEE